MPRLVHLARSSTVRSIERAGIRGPRTTVLGPTGKPLSLDHGVFAMPLTPDFATTYQWVRELRRWHDERMVAVHVVLSSDEEVLVGRYNAAHQRLPLGDAIRRVINEPLGNELVVPRSLRRREIVAIREITQLVGWAETPDARGAWDCFCAACIAPGTRRLLPRVRAAFERCLLAARTARSPADALLALRPIDTLLERANGRIAPDPLLVLARSEHDDLRKAATHWLGQLRWAQVEDALVARLADRNAGIRECAVESLVRAGGVRRAYARIATSDDELRGFFVEHLRYQRDTAVAADLLARASASAGPPLRRRIARIAGQLIADDALDAPTRSVLAALTAPS